MDVEARQPDGQWKACSKHVSTMVRRPGVVVVKCMENMFATKVRISSKSFLFSEIHINLLENKDGTSGPIYNQTLLDQLENIMKNPTLASSSTVIPVSTQSIPTNPTSLVPRTDQNLFGIFNRNSQTRVICESFVQTIMMISVVLIMKTFV